jgi:pyridoxine 4-dehydrogenase
MTTRRRKLGRGGPEVGELGLGCMGMSDFYGPADRAESMATIGAALETGVTLLDTGDFYGAGHNEMLIAEALRGRRRENVALSVKFGALRDPSGSWVGYDARPKAVKNFVGYSLKRLGTDYIDIYRPARLDPDVPIEETIGAIADLVKSGYIRHIGLSEMGRGDDPPRGRRPSHLRPADRISLIARMIEAEILPTCRELGIGVTAYGVLARGLISGHWSKAREQAPDTRKSAPRFAGENLEHNLALVEVLKVVARDRGATVAAIAIAWALARGPDIVPLVGARRRAQWAESSAALRLTLSPADVEAIEAAIPKGAAKGDRYPTFAMAHLDSERG